MILSRGSTLPEARSMAVERRGGLSFSSSPLEGTLQQAEQEEQRTDHDARPPGAQRAVERDHRLHDAEDQHADERAGDIADAAAEQRAADHDGGDRVELEADGMQAVARQHVEREDDAGERRAEPAERVDED